MKRVLVLGCRGMLGRTVRKHLAERGDLTVDGTHRDPLPGTLQLVADGGPAPLTLLLREGRYDYTINCLGITADRVDPADPGSIARAIRANSLFPHELASAAAEAGTRVIHISTDGVFGPRPDPIPEDARPDALDAYGRTKALGEARAPGFLTLRCSIIGPDPGRKRGLLEWFLSIPEGSSVPGYSDCPWNGVTTLQFAELCGRLIEGEGFQEVIDESPVHHVCPHRPVSKLRLLEMFREAFRREVRIRAAFSPEPSGRVLTTRFQSLKRLLGADPELPEAIGALVSWREKLSA